MYQYIPLKGLSCIEIYSALKKKKLYSFGCLGLKREIGSPEQSTFGTRVFVFISV